MSHSPNVFVTGACGYVGRLAISALAKRPEVGKIVATDLRETATFDDPRVIYAACDIRDRSRLLQLMRTHEITCVVHLAAVVNPPPSMSHAQLHEIEVGGTENVLQAALQSGARKIIVTSSGAAYGYHADSAALLREDSPLRGNDEFAYSRHKRLVEELLATWRAQNPELQQLIFRPGTILGERVSNQITALFEKRVVPGVRGAETPFVFTWDADLVACIVEGVLSEKTGIYNMVSDGVMTMREIARAMGGRYVALPAQSLQFALATLKRLGLSQYGPEQVGFLRYRPVMSNDKLKREFGYTPRKTSREVFDLYRSAHRP